MKTKYIKYIVAACCLLTGCATTPCYDIAAPEYRTDHCMKLRAANSEMDKEFESIQSSPPPADYGYGSPGYGGQYDQYGRPIYPQQQQYPGSTTDPRFRQQYPVDQWGRPVQQQSDPNRTYQTDPYYQQKPAPGQPYQYDQYGRPSYPQQQQYPGTTTDPRMRQQYPVDQWGRPVEQQPEADRSYQTDPYEQEPAPQPDVKNSPVAPPRPAQKELWRSNQK